MVGEAQVDERPKISVAIVAMNEEDRLPACLESVQWGDEILLVDSHSTDRTRDVAREYGAQVIERDWPGFGEQKRFAAATVSHDWVFSIDADERVTPELQEEIRALRERGLEADGYTVPRLSWYLGKWVRHGTWYPDRQLRLWNRNKGNWNHKVIHERVEVDGHVVPLDGDIVHLPYHSLQDHLSVINRYTDVMVADMVRKGRKVRAYDMLTHPAMKFVRDYLIDGGFLHGWRGFIMSCLATHYTQMKYAKLWLASRVPDPDLPPEERDRPENQPTWDR